MDCANVWAGDKLLDNCGSCDNDSSNDCIQDCNDDWGGDAVEDNCGSCDNDSSNDCIQDCNGDWGGIAVLDQCGVCNGDLSSCSGCTDYEAENYDSDAIIDDGSCTFSPYNGYHSLRFDGMDDYVIVDNIVPDNIGFTISGWIKIDNDASGNLNVFCYGDDLLSSGSFYVRLTDFETYYEPRLYVGFGENTKWGGEGTLLKDTWYHITALITEEKRYKLLINGNLVSAVTRNDHQLASSAIFSIGASLSGTNNFQGIIDEIAIWSSKLEDNVTTIYNLGMFYEDVNSLLDLDPNLEGYWRLNEGGGTIVTDLSGNNNHGTIFGAEWLEYNCVADNCGTCDIDMTNDCVLDCTGTWGGNASADDCGCTDTDAVNYNSVATFDDGSCINFNTQIDGCLSSMNSNADNVNLTGKIINYASVVITISGIVLLNNENGIVFIQGLNTELEPNNDLTYSMSVPLVSNLFEYINGGYKILWKFEYNGIPYEYIYNINGTIGGC